MTDFWANETARQADAGNPLYGGESRDWSTTMKTLTYKEIEARLNAVLALCIYGIRHGEGGGVYEIIIAAAGGVTP